MSVGPLKIAVIGAGIGGLSAAVALGKSGHDVFVFEKLERFRPAGAGISLWPNGVMALKRLGLADAISGAGADMATMAYRDRFGKVLTSFSLEPLYQQTAERALVVSRSVLQQILLDAVGKDSIHFGFRCASITDGPQTATVHFNGGCSFAADFVVIAGGTHYPFRSDFSSGPSARRYVGYVNFNALVDGAGRDGTDGIYTPDTWTTFVGQAKRVSSMPVGGTKRYVFFDVPQQLTDGDDIPSPMSELRECFSGWALEVQDLIERLQGHQINRIPIHDHESLDTYVSGRKVLLGDAAHSMAPDLGQGGCQALEDSIELEQCLKIESSVDLALARYDSKRVARANPIVRRARQRAELIHGTDPQATQRWYEELASESGEKIISGIAQSVFGGPCG